MLGSVREEDSLRARASDRDAKFGQQRLVGLDLVFVRLGDAPLELLRRRVEGSPPRALGTAALYAQASSRIPRGVQVGAALVSVLTMGGLVVLQFARDLERMLALPLGPRWRALDLTSLELFGVWVLVGLSVYRGVRRNPDAAQDLATPVEGPSE